jgi:hypothetical protein
MSEEIMYGRKEKRIVFTDTDHRHAQLIIRLKHDGLTQSSFFRHLITGYIEGDRRIQDFINEMGELSQAKKRKSKVLANAGKKTLSALGIGEEQVEDIFDLIAEEHPDL